MCFFSKRSKEWNDDWNLFTLPLNIKLNVGSIVKIFLKLITLISFFRIQILHLNQTSTPKLSSKENWIKTLVKIYFLLKAFILYLNTNIKVLNLLFLYFLIPNFVTVSLAFSILLGAKWDVQVILFITHTIYYNYMYVNVFILYKKANLVFLAC